MEYLTGKCKIDFNKWAIDNFGYSSTYYLGFPTMINFFNNTMKEFDQTIVYFLTSIHHIINITYNVLIAIAICKIKKI